MANQYASAGNAAETTPVENPIGLYRNPDGKEIGVLEPAAGDAVVRQGYVLVEEGREAAMKSASTKEEKAKGDK